MGDVGDNNLSADLEILYRNTENPLTPSQKAALVGTMRKCGGESHLPLFRSELATASDENLRASLAIALAELVDRSGTPVFLEGLTSDNASAQRVSAQYLQLLYEQDFGTDVTLWRKWIVDNATQPPDESYTN